MPTSGRSAWSLRTRRCCSRRNRRRNRSSGTASLKAAKINGVVKRLTDFGAFVDVGGVDGLLHISDLAWSRVKHPSDVVSEGQELELLVLNVDPAKKKIALGYKQLLPKPWELVPEKYNVGDTVKGKVVRIVPFGAFVQLEPTVDGLITYFADRSAPAGKGGRRAARRR